MSKPDFKERCPDPDGPQTILSVLIVLLINVVAVLILLAPLMYAHARCQ